MNKSLKNLLKKTCLILRTEKKNNQDILAIVGTLYSSHNFGDEWQSKCLVRQTNEQRKFAKRMHVPWNGHRRMVEASQQ